MGKKFNSMQQKHSIDYCGILNDARVVQQFLCPHCPAIALFISAHTLPTAASERDAICIYASRCSIVDR